MAKRTAVIDIGSNSVRMAVFERTSRFGFYILREAKSKVRISEGAYEKGGVLQEYAMLRAQSALKEFAQIAKTLKVRKILCVATSALRDAPNKSDFVARIRQTCGLNIRIIDGEKEAKMGAVAAVNLLPITDAITVDIGGGSTELALIKEGKIRELISLNIGTVRLKELFFDQGYGVKKAVDFIRKILVAHLPPSYKSSTLIGIGGTNRALATMIMGLENYPLETLHAYTYGVKKYASLFEKLVDSEPDKLSSLKIKPDRLDVIRQGALIMRELFTATGATQVITSGVGVREGVFLSDLLRGNGGKFPPSFNPSVRALLDRFELEGSETRFYTTASSKLFDILAPLHCLDISYKHHLSTAAKLCNIGASLNYYNKSVQGYALVISNLNFGFTHSDKVLIGAIIRYLKKKYPRKAAEPEVDILGINIDAIRWLGFMLTLAQAMAISGKTPQWSGELKGDNLVINIENLYLFKEKIAELYVPKGLRLEVIMKEPYE